MNQNNKNRAFKPKEKTPLGNVRFRTEMFSSAHMKPESSLDSLSFLLLCGSLSSGILIAGSLIILNL